MGRRAPPFGFPNLTCTRTPHSHCLNTHNKWIQYIEEDKLAITISFSLYFGTKRDWSGSEKPAANHLLLALSYRGLQNKQRMVVFIPANSGNQLSNSAFRQTLRAAHAHIGLSSIHSKGNAAGRATKAVLPSLFWQFIATYYWCIVLCTFRHPKMRRSFWRWRTLSPFLFCRAAPYNPRAKLHFWQLDPSHYSLQQWRDLPGQLFRFRSQMSVAIAIMWHYCLQVQRTWSSTMPPFGL